MSNLDQKRLVTTFSKLGEQLGNPNDQLTALIHGEQNYNAWFTPASVAQAVQSISSMLSANDLERWLNGYELKNQDKKIGIILAGNIPLVGFHDVLCVLASGNIALIKASSQDARLIKYVLHQLVEIDGDFADRYQFADRIEKFDAVIATGSNNSSRYFDYYFGRVPNVIRKNRNSIALLTGKETSAEFQLLGRDIFDYYGLGCRNVSKLLVPAGYDFVPFFEAIESYQPIINHHKYNNNYDYNKSIYLVNRDQHFDNGFLLVKADERLASPLAVLFYQEYADLKEATAYLEKENERIQCVVSNQSLAIPGEVVGFGQTQRPRLWDYADGVDTMQFLVNL
jgi:hypothetical protein